MLRLLITLICSGVFLAGGWAVSHWIVDETPPPAVQEGGAPGPVPVKWVEARGQDVPLTVTGQGNLMPGRTAVLASEVGGVLLEVAPSWQRGVPVREGQLLWRTDPTELQLLVDRGRAAKRQAEVSLEVALAAVDQAAASESAAREHRDSLAREEQRVLGLVTDEFLPASQLDRAVAARSSADQRLAQAMALAENAQLQVRAAAALEEERTHALDHASARLDKCSVRAPFAGRLVGPAPAIGTYLPPGMQVCQLVDGVHLLAQIPAQRSHSLRVGMAAEVNLPAYPGQSFTADVLAISSTADVTTRSIAVEFALDRSGLGTLPAGLFAQVRVDVGILRGALAFGRELFTFFDGKPHLYVLAQDVGGHSVVDARAVELRSREGEQWILGDGIVEGERVVVSPLALLSPGARVSTPVGVSEVKPQATSNPPR